MKTPALGLGLLLASVTTSGCAALLPSGGIYGRYPVMRPAPMPLIDPYTAARGRWDSVMRLPAGAVIDVLTMDGAAHVGKISGVDGYRVGVLISGIEEQIPRADVVRIDLVDLPGSEVAAVTKRAAGGAVLGIGAMALLGAVIGGEAWPPPAVLLRGGAAIGGVAGAESSLVGRRRRVIYLAEDQRLLLRPSGPGGDLARGAWPLRAVEAYSADQWSVITQLPAETVIAVLTTRGARHQGSLVAADDAAIRIDVGQAELRILRTSVTRVEVLRIS